MLIKSLSIKVFFAFFTIALLFSCSSSPKKKANPNIPPKFIEKTPIFKNEGELFFTNLNKDTLAFINIELANTPEKREKGLMHRKEMKEQHGMLFIFDDERRQSFWMQNTHIALDIIFVNSSKEIVHIAHDNAPYSMKQIPSVDYAQFVVEVNAGYCKKHKITSGASIDFNITN